MATKRKTPADETEAQHDDSMKAPQVLMFGVGLIGLVFAVVWFSLVAPGRHWEMAIAAAASVVLLGLSGGHGFDTLKAGKDGVEVAREARRAAALADASAEKAFATVAQVRTAALALGRITAELLSRGGTFSSIAPLPDRLQLQEDLENELRGLGVDDERIAVASRRIRKHAQSVHVRKLLDAAVHVDQSKGSDLQTRLRAAVAPAKDANGAVPDIASQVRDAVIALKFENDPTVLDALLDLEHFERTGKCRRDEIWRRKDA